MFKMENVTVQINEKFILNNLSFTVPKGQISVIIGESGSGKSTTLSAILGILPAQATVEGSIFFNGRNLVDLAKQDQAALRQRHFYTIFQDAANSFSPTQKIKQQLYGLTALRMGQTMTVFLAKMKRIVQDLHLPDDVLERYPFELSGGMLQRCMLACALYLEPAVLLADEPTSSLDMLHQQEFIQQLKRLHSQLETTVLLITHDLDVAASIADFILVMKNGEIVERGQVTEIFEQPKHPYTRQLVAHQF